MGRRARAPPSGDRTMWRGAAWSRMQAAAATPDGARTGGNGAGGARAPACASVPAPNNRTP
eukprot:5185101-Prymnesium_polylepis.1